MNMEWQRFAALMGLTLLGVGILGFMGYAIGHDGKLTGDDGGWIIAGFLSLREVISKIENVALGNRAPVTLGESEGA